MFTGGRGMINVFCDTCKFSSNSKMQIRVEGNSIVIECLECGDAKRFKKQGDEE